MSNSPTVSVVIPTFNRAHMLGRAIQSVVNQTFHDWELLVIDDGSTDGTQSAVKGFCDARIYYVRHEVNKGAQAARNTGIGESRGEYLAFLDSDDEWLPEKLEQQMRLFRRDSVGDLGVVLCDTLVIKGSPGGVPASSKRPFLQGWVYEDLLSNRFRGPKTTFLVKRAAIIFEPAFDESICSSQDLDFLIRMAATCRFDFVPEPLVRVYRHAGPRIQTGFNAILGKEQLLKKYAAELRERPKSLREHHLRLARAYSSNGDKANARRHISEARQASHWVQAPYFFLLSAISDRLIFRKLLKARNFSYLMWRLRMMLNRLVMPKLLH